MGESATKQFDYSVIEPLVCQQKGSGPLVVLIAFTAICPPNVAILRSLYYKRIALAATRADESPL